MPRPAMRHAVLLLGFLVVTPASRGEAQIFSTAPTANGTAGETVHESMLAVGPEWVLHLTTKNVDFHLKTPDLGLGPASSTPLATFFQTTIVRGDPVAFYDALRGRYLIAAMGPRENRSVLLMIQKGGTDPRVPANWWKYELVDPVAEPDYPGLGVSDDKIVVGWQSPWTTRRFYEVLDREQAYEGVRVGASVEEVTGSYFYKACRNLTADATIHLVALQGGGLYHRTLTGAATSPQLSNPVAVTDPPAFLPHPGGQQPDDGGQNSCQARTITAATGHLADLYMRNGNISVAWPVVTDNGDGSASVYRTRCIRFRASDGQLLDDFTLGRPGRNYTYPSIAEDALGTLFVGFDVLAADAYASSYMVARRGGQQSPEFLVGQGSATYFKCKPSQETSPGVCGSIIWGDYSSLAMDEPASGPDRSVARFAGGRAETPIKPDTEIGTLIADYGSCAIAGRVLADLGGTEAPRPGAQVELEAITGAAGFATATTDAAGQFSFGLLPAGTYRLRSSWGAAVAAEARAGTGGTSQVVVSASEIEIVVQGSQSSAGNELVVTEQPSPQVTSISPTWKNSQEGDFTLVVEGQGFLPHSVVRFNGRDKVTTYVSPTELRAQVLHHDIAYPARVVPNAITVFTPAAPGSGSSAPTPFVSLERFLASPPTYSSSVMACPAGDAGHLTITVELQSYWWCGINASCTHSPPPLATLTLASMTPEATTRVWEGERSPYYPMVTLTSSGTCNPATQTRTYTFDVARISGCGELYVNLQVAGEKTQLVTFPSVEIRSPDLDALVRGTVDRFDASALTAMLGTTNPCGDLVVNGQVDAADLNFLADHESHHFPRHVLTPDGGETYTRTTGGAPPIPITWEWGGGDSALVTINLVDGPQVTPVAMNEPDDGERSWSTYCNVIGSGSKQIEVIHHVGAFRAEGPMAGSDLSDEPFTIQGTCSSGGGCNKKCPTESDLEVADLAPGIRAVRPNPFSNGATVHFTTPRACEPEIQIFDLAGRRVREERLAEHTPGVWQWSWDGSGREGEAMRAGVYFLQLRLGDYVERRQLVKL